MADRSASVPKFDVLCRDGRERGVATSRGTGIERLCAEHRGSSARGEHRRLIQHV